jgi:hypothetical protein
MPPYRNGSPKPSAGKTLNALRKGELIELAELLDQEIEGTATVLQLRAILQPIIEQAVEAGITHADFARILPAPQREPSDDKDEDKDDETAGFCGVVLGPPRRGPASIASSTASTRRIPTSNVSASANLSRRRASLKRKVAFGRPATKTSTIRKAPRHKEKAQDNEGSRSWSPYAQSEPDLDHVSGEHRFHSSLTSISSMVTPSLAWTFLLDLGTSSHSLSLSLFVFLHTICFRLYFTAPHRTAQHRTALPIAPWVISCPEIIVLISTMQILPHRRHLWRPTCQSS